MTLRSQNLDTSQFYPRQGGLLTLTVHGNHGFLTVDKLTGRVLHYEQGETDEYCDIVKVDLNEFYATYSGRSLIERIDILDIGFWALCDCGEVIYTEPEHEWRELIVDIERSVIRLGAH